MVKFASVLLFILCLSCSSTESSQQGSEKELGDDASVLKEVNRIMKSELSADEICVERPSSFKDLILVGFFAHDRGCAGGMKFYKGKEVNNDTDHSIILKDNGWNEKHKREVLALNWVKEVSLAWSTAMEKEDEDFGKQEEHTFMPPTVTTMGDEISVAVWVRSPTGMSPEANFHLLTVVFSATKADIIRSQITDRFYVEF